ncbi:BREX-1 system adenine-specific DNA-methyltransferase PglX [Rhodococcus sp. AD45-ID]|uniref:BREX-1 system adenine-specific DNA-methyltransferase PglX n=1 Tax=unclassified Rhodococcus (in: high G+C Gram-positive bacteria) TaxID=192944 RepID=UPI0005D33A33|nr:MULTISPECIES: BREX-1 system adenine-specific DNA-methyltransferase PglX [unclassified Rhodococcus (in: high G+C Gram-positive bacteria)]KJF25087.1 Type I restriction-modification system methyltransferase subunit [Rhodococcus sp. AD45]PSR43291.1 BREX-1 system adenine-specific DNA-methyltransferase PglX [Rhodococcus sp. AD45-ID]
MYTKPLESFAKAARRELIVAVEARVSTVLAAGSVARSERAETVRLLESEIACHGREHLIDRVAYTWFNRLIALRFMDARGYTDAGIVSPASGQAHGQPEILADAKRGDISTEVVTNAGTHAAIIGLLDGTRRSTDAEGEAYALLLTEYCRYWHKTMPFMFDAEGAYTELLVPAGLLADGALLSRAREVLTEDVCNDVEVIGWLYQFYISERKDEVFAGFKKNKKAGADEIPAATQLFTPHWIVRYLLENSLGRLWMLNRPTSRLVDQMDYYIAPIEEETDFLRVSGPEELTVIDPACGSGHMLTYAFDLLYSIYEEEGYAPSEIPSLILAHNLHGTEIDPRAGALASFALTMKARARDRRFLTRSGVEPKVCVIEPISFSPDELDLLVTKSGNRGPEEAFWNQFRDAAILGSLIQPDADATKQAAAVLDGLQDLDETLYYDTLNRVRNAVAQADALSRRYSVVTANPPYMGSKNMDTRLAEFAKDAFPDGKQDLYGCFVLRSIAFAVPGGFVAKIIGDTWMSIVSFKNFREDILSGHSFDSFVHLRDISNHPDIFGANAAFVLSMTNAPGKRVPFVRLTPLNENEKRIRLVEAIRNPACEWRYTASSEDLAKVPGTPVAYWLSDVMRAAFNIGQPLSTITAPRQGLSTADNDRFLRTWWEVDLHRTLLRCETREESEASSARWFPHNKGGSFRKWWGNQEHLVNWEGGGRELESMKPKSVIRNSSTYFRPSVSWSRISSGDPAFRVYPNGFTYNDVGPSVFFGDAGFRYAFASLANSSVAHALLQAVAPTLHFDGGQIAQLPICDAGMHERARLAEENVAVSRADWDDFETSWDFKNPSWLRSELAGKSLAEWYAAWSIAQAKVALEQQAREMENNRVVAEAYGLLNEVPIDVPLHRVSLTRNVEFLYGPGRTAAEYEVLERADLAAELISYAVGCMFGRYSLDAPALILAHQGATLRDYFAKVLTGSTNGVTGSTSDITFMPDADNVIPFVDDGWFEDDIVEQFRQFLKAAFAAEHFEENLRFIEESLGVKTLRDYFVTKSGRSKFYDDHVKRYKKRPIYWMFSSPKGSFNALIYLHRYTPSTVSTVLNEYLREYENKLQKAFERAEAAAAGGTSVKDQKEADRLRKVLAELRDYEHDVLYPLATQQVEIDLDDGVKVNYPKFYPAVKKIVGLQSSDG